jgi:hypothetical protein
VQCTNRHRFAHRTCISFTALQHRRDQITASRLSLHDGPTLPTRSPARADRLADALSVHVCSDDLRRSELDHLQRSSAVHPDHRTRALRDPARHSVLGDAVGCGYGRPRRRQLCLEYGQYLLLLPGPHQGLGTGVKCGWRQYWCERRAVADTDSAGVRVLQPCELGRGGTLSAKRRTHVVAAAHHRGYPAPSSS